MLPAPDAVLYLLAVQNSTSLVLAWCPPRNPNGVILAYEVSYNNSVAINTTDTSTTLVIPLPHGTIVSDVSVRAYTSAGPGDGRNVPTLNSCELMSIIKIV